MAYYSIPRNGLVGEFLLDGNPNDTNDGTKNNGTATNVTYVTSDVGYQKQCGSFNGSSSKITITNPLGASQTAFSISLRVKIASTSGFQYLMGPGSNGIYFVYNNTNSKLEAKIYNGSYILICQADPDLNKWHDYTYEWSTSQGNAKLYVDGVLASTSGDSRATSIDVSQALTLGTYNGGAVSWYNGLMQDVRFYSAILTETERLQLWHEFNRKLGGGSDFGAYIPAPKYQWDFMGDAIDVANAVAPDANSGTFAGTDYFGITKGITYSGATKTDIPTISGVDTFTWVYRFKTSQGSLGAIFAPTGSGQSPTIYAYMGIVSTDKFSFMLDYTGSNGYNTVTSTTSLNDNAWHTVIVTGDGTSNGLKMYVDGTLEKTASDGRLGKMNNATYPSCSFGYRRFDNSNYLAASVSDIALYPQAFTSSQVTYMTNLLKQKYAYSFRRSIPSSLSNGLLFRGGAFNGSTMYDESGNGYNFTGTATKVRAGQLDAGSFSSQLLTLTRSAALENANGSIACHFKTSSRANAGTLIGNNNVINSDRNGVLIYEDTSGLINFEVATASTFYRCTTAVAFDDGKIHRAVGTWDGSNIKLYIDGALMASAVQSTAVAYSSQDFKLGGDTTNGTRYFNGILAYPTLWNRALNSYEVMMDRYSTYVQ